MLKKISRTQLLFFIIVIVLFSLYDFILKPVIKERYLSSELTYFENSSWKYTIGVFVILLIITLVRLKKKDLIQLPIIILFLGGISIGSHGIIKGFLLYINSQTEREKTIRNYKVVSHEEYSTFWLDAHKNSIHDHDDLNKVNQFRIKKNQKSLFKYKDKDTVNVVFKKGIMNLNYLY